MSTPDIEFTHNHGILDNCPESCPAHYWYDKIYPGQAVQVYYQKKPGGARVYISTKYDKNVTKYPVPPKTFNKDQWYPNVPLATNEDAFLWYATDSTGQEGDVYDDNSHWRIIDRMTKKNIYDFLKETENSNVPMLWGYTVDLGNEKMYVKFLTHLSPGKQDLEYIGQCIVDLEKKFKKTVTDYDIEDTHTPILESFTPSGETSGYSTTNYADKPVYKPQVVAPEEPKVSGEAKTIKKDILADGVTVYTTFLGEYAPDPEWPFETAVFRSGPENAVMTTLVTAYAKDEHEALANHYKYVDKYNRVAEAVNTALGTDPHTQITSYFNDPGTLKKAELYPIPLKLYRTGGLKALEITPGEDANHKGGERPFMYHQPSNTLFYTTKPCHHVNIIPLINKYLEDNGQSYDGPWVTGDITEPNITDRNWIKFIGSDTGHYPRSVINYMQNKFGPRELVHNGEDDWESLPEDFIQEE